MQGYAARLALYARLAVLRLGPFESLVDSMLRAAVHATNNESVVRTKALESVGTPDFRERVEGKKGGDFGGGSSTDDNDAGASVHDLAEDFGNAAIGLC
jgi:hypothetical protein